MTSVTVVEHIGKPPEVVFAAATDFERAAEMISGITRVEMLEKKPGAEVGLGTRFRETRKMYGKEASEEMEVSVWEAPKRYCLTAQGCGCRYLSEFRFEAEDKGTRVTMTFRGEPLTWWARILSWIMRPMMTSVANECVKDLQDLKRYIEEQK